MQYVWNCAILKRIMTFAPRLLCLFLGCLGAAFAQNCSVATLSGPFAYAMKGTITGANNRPVTSSEVGRVQFDGKGAFTGVAAFTSGGSATVVETKGTVEIASDCTATGKLTYPGTTVDFDMVVTSGGLDFGFVVRATDGTLSGSGTKIESVGSCTAATIAGSYGFQGEGVTVLDGKAVSVADIGVLNFDGKGGMTGSFSTIAGGQAARSEFTGGIYEMTDVCFGSAGYKLGDATYQFNFVVASGSNQILYSELAPSYVVTGVGIRTVLK